MRSFGTPGAGVLHGYAPNVGGRLILHACGAGAFIAIGAQRAFPALDLGAVGAPGQFVHLLPIAILPTYTVRLHDGAGCSRLSAFSTPVPNRADLEGARVYAQMLFPSPGSNPLGVLVTNALELTVASAPYYASAAVFGFASATLGVRTDFAPVVRFTGTFQ